MSTPPLARARRATPRRALVVGSLALGAAVLAGCSGGTTAAGGAPPSSSASSSAAAGGSSVDPNAPEPAAAGDIPDDQAFVPFSPPGAPFSVSVPEGWARSSASASSTTFTDKLSSVTVDVSTPPSAPTPASVEAAELPAVASSASGYRAGKTREVTRTAGTVIESTYRADAAPDPVTGKVVDDDVSRYVYYRSGTEVALTLAGPHGADDVDPWRTITDSFTWS